MPKDWKIARIGDVTLPVKRYEIPVVGKTYRQIGVRLWGKGAYERGAIDGSETRYAKLFRVENGDIIVNKIWARNGSVAVITDELNGCFGSSEFPTFAPDRSMLEPRWFHWITKTKRFWNACDEKSRGTSGKNRIRPEKFLDIEIPLPPLAEQRRIVTRIEALAKRIAEAQSLRQSAVEEAGNLMGYKIAALFNNANDWQEFKLGDLTLESLYGTSAKAHVEKMGTPVLRMGNIQDGKIDLTNLKYMFPSEKEMQKIRLQKGDILVNRTNSAELVGKCAVFNLDGEYLFASYIIRLRLDEQKADPYLVAQYINSPIGRAYMFAERKQMTGQANVNSKKIAAMPIKLPPLAEQRHIVTYLDGLSEKVNQLRELQAASQAELDALLPSVLEKAFNGEL